MKILKNIIACIMTVIIVLLGATKVGKILDPAWVSGSLNAVKAFHTLPPNSTDVIVYGSSHAWKGFDPRHACSEYNLNIYNYACNWQALNTSLLFIQDSLKHQSPQVILLDMFNVDYIKADADFDGEIYYTKGIENSVEKQEYLKKCFNGNIERYASYYLPIIVFHDNWSKISSENFIDYCTVDEYIKNCGYEVGNGVYPSTFNDYSTFVQLELKQESLEVLDKIVEICEKNHIKLVLYTCPYEGQFHYSKALKQYAEEHKHVCDYVDLFEYIEIMGLSGETDLRDPGHLNDSGADKVANFLTKYIVEKGYIQ